MSEKIYAWLLCLYPSRFRKAYGDAALQLYRDRARDERGFLSGLRLWLDLLADLAISIPHEYRYIPPTVLAGSAQQCWDGIPSFHILEGEAPSLGSLFYGGLLSLAIYGFALFLLNHGGSRFPLADPGAHRRPSYAVPPTPTSPAEEPTQSSGEERSTAEASAGEKRTATEAGGAEPAALEVGSARPGKSAASHGASSASPNGYKPMRATATVVFSYSPDSPAVGSVVRFTATVHAADGGPMPTGDVRFFAGATVVQAGALQDGSVRVDGVAPKRTRSFRAIYDGDANYYPASSTGTGPAPVD
jgi:hypothetical protein